MLSTVVYWSNMSEHKEYTTRRGIYMAVDRMRKSDSGLMDLRGVLSDEDYKEWFKWNWWVEIALVKPYKDGYVIVREFSVR